MISVSSVSGRVGPQAIVVAGSGSAGDGWERVLVRRREYLGQFPVHVAVLPSRVVYLIAEGSAEGFRRAVREACTRWGGITEPIVEVGVEGGLSNDVRNVIETADVQAAVNVDVEAGRAASVARLVGLPLVPIAGIDDEDFGLAPCSWGAVFADAGVSVWSWPRSMPRCGRSRSRVTSTTRSSSGPSLCVRCAGP
ncbi:hypothetical protein [Embleya sp. NBC_00896]|uniref:hypothetical protein n=1 Tax=Embleya sp. NBC_00896 TaxID=2975961 RepID=UPI003870AA0F|nr:hypothetical protein OG928_46625 [Embleya sp. NBC_00896]